MKIKLRPFLWGTLVIAANAPLISQEPPGIVADTPEVENAALDSDFPPAVFEPRNYDVIWQKNPFVRATQTEEEVVVDNWAEGLIVRSVNLMDDKYVVYVENLTLTDERKTSKRFYRIVEGETDPNGFRIVSIDPNPDPYKVSVKIARGTGAAMKTAEIKYDEGILKSKKGASLTPAAPPPQQQPGEANQPPRRGGNQAAPAAGGNDRTRSSRLPNRGGGRQNNRRVILPPNVQN